MKIRIISNLSKIGAVKSDEYEIDLYPCDSAGYDLKAVFSIFIRSFKYDYILLNGAPRMLFLIALFKLLIPFHRTKLVVLDILLSKPNSIKDKIKAFIISLLLKKVHLLLLYYRDTTGLEATYSIAPGKFRYVPFKINQIDLINRTEPTDEGYIFCGGKTRRDFNTLFEAVRDTQLPVKIATTENRDIAEHGSFLDEAIAPDNVDILILDGSADKFIQLMAAARVVAMPIIPDICGAGIGVYIMAMALKKCVVISNIPGTSDIIPPKAAIVIPPSDPVALGKALSSAYYDSDYRNSIEEAAFKYALALQGEERLMSSVATVIYQDFKAGADSIHTGHG